MSKLKEELDQAGVALYGVVHETRGVDAFKPYLKGDVYLDVEVSIIIRMIDHFKVTVSLESLMLPVAEVHNGTIGIYQSCPHSYFSI